MASIHHLHYSGIGAGYHVSHKDIIDDIDALVGDYLAWQTESEVRERSRRNSAGTLVVDWDGSGYGHAFYRGRTSSVKEGIDFGYSSASRTTSSATSRGQTSTASRTKPSYTASTVSSSAKSKQPRTKPRRDSGIDMDFPRYDDWAHVHPKVPSRRESTEVNFHRDNDHRYGHADISVTYSPITNTARGHDPATQLHYAYNGETMHIHERQRHSRSRADAAQLDAYFSVPVEQYRNTNSHSTISSSSRVKITHIPQQQHKHLTALSADKKRTVKSFVKRVLSKLNSAGVLGKMRKEREEARKSEIWVRDGYLT
ncbi:hypothetical protein IQ06DRAFT_304352 [Phaeosphaeriaceae sp. SRC1lsM3a]|nr:hypothetical protein IQ06DRAFT_304352 [Stagonospora sp. SRC1lsM3a]